jgi:hypothetical protein
VSRARASSDPQLPRSYDILSLVIAAVNVGSAVSLILLNRHLFAGNHFPYTVVLSAVHVAVTGLAVRLLARAGLFAARAVPTGLMLLIAATRVGALIGMNVNLMVNPLSVYQLSKIMCLPLSALAERILGRRIFSPSAVIALAATTVGVAVATISSPETSPRGIFVAAAACVATVISFLAGWRVKPLGLSSLQMIRVEAPVSAALLLFVSPAFDDVGALAASPPPPRTLALMGLTALLAVVVNITGFMTIVRLSPVDYLMCGQVKTLAVLAAGLLASGALPPPKVAAGVALALAGLYGYTREQMASQRRKDRKR